MNGVSFFSAPRADLERIYHVPFVLRAFYVIDAVGSAGVIGGPFETAVEAERQRLGYSIADDCDVVMAA